MDFYKCLNLYNYRIIADKLIKIMNGHWEYMIELEDLITATE